METQEQQQEADYKLLTVAKIKCLRSLEFFTRYFFKKQYKKKFIVGDPHRIMFEALERVVLGQCKRLIIEIAPRYGKTELAVKALIAYCLALNASAKFIHLSYSDDLALDNSETIKDLVNSEDFQMLFPEVTVKKDSKAKNKWYTTQGGGVLARAAGGSVTGFGAGRTDTEEETEAFIEAEGKETDEFLQAIEKQYEGLTDLERKMLFGGCIIIDDAIKPEDADSDLKREAVNQRFDSTIRNRANSRNTPIIVIGQRLHPRDLSGYLQRAEESDAWEVISLPSINAHGNKYGLVPGQALLPWKHTLTELLKLKAANPLVFGRQHLQDPSPKHGLLFPEGDLQYYDPVEMAEALSNCDFVYMPCDPANEGGDDFAFGPAKLIGDKIYVTDMLYNTDGEDTNEVVMYEMITEHKPAAVGVEGVLGWKETAERIRNALNEKNFIGEFRILRPRTNKHVRINNRAAFIRNNFVFRRDYESYPQYAKFMRCLTTYQKIQEAGKRNKHDDAPDWCEMAATYYERNFPHLWPTLK